MKRPNLLLIFADQMRAAAAACYGHPYVRTPNLDRLARQGVRCTNTIANYPVCGPMRAGMWTGTHPTTHGVVGNDLAVRTDLPTLATVLRDAGYRCGYVGKWHLDGVPRRKFTPPGPRRLGFDDFWAAYNCAHDYDHPYYFRDTDERVEPDGYEPTVMTDLALQFLNERDDRPSALVLSLGPPHDPYPQVPEKFRALYDPATIPLPGNVEPQTQNPLAARLDCRRTLADYHAAVTAVDEQLGRLMAAAGPDTLIMFTSDHGDMLWSHGLMKKQVPYEESILVPLVAAGPMLPRGVENDALIGLTDLTPTLLGLLGIEVPASMQAANLAATFAGAAGPDTQLIANPFSTDEALDQSMPEWRGVRTARHTYVEQVGRVPWLLFDKIADPLQQHNLIGTPGSEALQRQLADELGRLLRSAADPFLPGTELLERMGLTQAWDDRNQRIYQ